VLPIKRAVVLDNLRRVFGDVLPESEIRRLAQAFYGHFGRFLADFVTSRFGSAEQRARRVRVENMDSPIRAHSRGKGLLILSGHFGNWEMATVAGIRRFPNYAGLFHFVRRPLKPRLLDEFVNWRFRRAGLGTIAKRGSLEAIYEVLSRGGVVVYVFDQHARGRDGILVDFLGHPASTFKSLAILAMDTQAPVIPASSWREPDGRHVIRFEEPIPPVEADDVGEAIRLNTQAYNVALERMLLRHPEQWIWMHRRWKGGAPPDARKPSGEFPIVSPGSSRRPR
jgi:KDO2-lipid IV(A) lauroyltransferase